MKNNKQKDPIPGNAASREELAQFWDTHSAADYWDELKPINVRFDETTLEKLREKAKKKGIGPTTLARMWILERLGSTP